MQTVNGLLQILVLIGAFLVFGAIACLPNWLGIAASNALRNSEQEMLQQAEIMRKVRIAEEAQAARRRGETFIPPADYNR